MDACAAPGNKTVHLAGLMRGKGKIIACELNKERLRRLKDTIKLAGAASIFSKAIWSSKCHLYFSSLICFLTTAESNATSLHIVWLMHTRMCMQWEVQSKPWLHTALTTYHLITLGSMSGRRFSSNSSIINLYGRISVDLTWLLDVEVLHEDFLNLNPKLTAYSKVSRLYLHDKGLLTFYLMQF